VHRKAGTSTPELDMTEMKECMDFTTASHTQRNIALNVPAGAGTAAGRLPQCGAGNCRHNWLQQLCLKDAHWRGDTDISIAPVWRSDCFSNQPCKHTSTIWNAKHPLHKQLSGPCWVSPCQRTSQQHCQSPYS
jgi:hypothetical protein